MCMPDGWILGELAAVFGKIKKILKNRKKLLTNEKESVIIALA